MFYYLKNLIIYYNFIFNKFLERYYILLNNLFKIVYYKYFFYNK